MALMRTANPALNPKTFTGHRAVTHPAHAMTLQGTVNRTGVLLVFVTLAAAFAWNSYRANPQAAAFLTALGALGGFVVALLTIFKRSWAPLTAPLYAILEGLFLGSLSAMLDAQFKGIAIQAVGLAFGTLLVLLLAYSSGKIKVTAKFRLGIVAATGGVAVLYLTTMFLGFFGVGIPYIYENGAIGIAFSLFVVSLAALNPVLDFDFIETGVA